ncbi:hypothetical protein BY996DRAFT_6622317 [Phakopsora pachyrhizi]|nr:hypothetical protein BY996DRAFT_6622317 [Phakopsora pachyrhizi]
MTREEKETFMENLSHPQMDKDTQMDLPSPAPEQPIAPVMQPISVDQEVSNITKMVLNAYQQNFKDYQTAVKEENQILENMYLHQCLYNHITLERMIGTTEIVENPNQPQKGIGGEKEREKERERDSGELPSSSGIQQIPGNRGKTSTQNPIQETKKEPYETESEQKEPSRFPPSYKTNHEEQKLESGNFPIPLSDIDENKFLSQLHESFVNLEKSVLESKTKELYSEINSLKQISITNRDKIDIIANEIKKINTTIKTNSDNWTNSKLENIFLNNTLIHLKTVIKELPDKLKTTLLRECKEIIDKNDPSKTIEDIQAAIQQQFFNLTNDITALANQGIDIPECVTDLNSCKEDIITLKNSNIIQNQSEIELMQQKYQQLENNMMLQQQQQADKIAELTENMNKLRITQSPRSHLSNTPPIRVAPHHQSTPSERTSVQDINPNENVTEARNNKGEARQGIPSGKALKLGPYGKVVLTGKHLRNDQPSY